jgi:hypothetical protein
MSTVGTVLIVWAAVLVVLVAALSIGSRRRPFAPGAPEVTVERRRGGDRRIGLPDRRAHRVERRSGAPDRRRVLGPA